MNLRINGQIYASICEKITGIAISNLYLLVLHYLSLLVVLSKQHLQKTLN